MARNIIECRDLVFQLFRRDFIAVYKKSFLGLSWVFLAPFFAIAAWILTYKTGILKPGVTVVPYPAYVLIGTFLWTTFLGFYSASVSTLSGGAGFISQVKYPHEVLFAKQCLQQLASSSITFLVNILALILFGVIPSWKIIFFPLLLLPLLLLGGALGLFVSVVGVVLQEVQKVFDVAWGLVFWLTPIVYTFNVQDGLLLKIIQINPLTYLICEARDIILMGRMNSVEGYTYSVIVSICLFLLSLRLFYLSEEKVIEKML